MDTSSAATKSEQGREEAQCWVERFLNDLIVVRSTNTVRAYRHDLERWIDFCRATAIEPLTVRPRDAIAFVRHERERPICDGGTVSARTIVRRLSAIRQWYAFLMLEPETTGVYRNPVPGDSTLRTAGGMVAGQPALLRYDRSHPEILTPEEIDRFIRHLTTDRDRAIVWLLKDAVLRIGEVLDLRLGDIHWAERRITVRATKTHTTRSVALSTDALRALSTYMREERPVAVEHDHVFVCLDRLSFGQPFRYRAWVAVCDLARQRAETPRVHAHAFRHTCATNLAEAGMPLDALQRQLGHRHIDTTMVYNEIRDGRLQREYRRAMEGVGGRTTNRRESWWMLLRPNLSRRTTSLSPNARHCASGHTAERCGRFSPRSWIRSSKPFVAGPCPDQTIRRGHRHCTEPSTCAAT